MKKPAKALSATVLLLLLASLPHAWMWTDSFFSDPAIASCRPDTGSDPFAWIILAFFAVMIGIMINAGSQVLNGAFNTPKYQEFLRGHLWTMVECTLLLAVLAITVVGLGNFGNYNIDTARAYAVLIRNTVVVDFSSVMFANVAVSLFTNVNPTIRPGSLTGIYISFQVAPMFRPLYDTLGMVIQLLVASIAQWFMHEFMLCAVKTVMLTMLVPAGLFLRAYGLKAGGNALIGVALALYFVYPFLIIQTGQAVAAYTQSELNPELSPPWCTDKPICCIGGWPAATASDLAAAPTGFSEPTIPNGNSENVTLGDRRVLNGEMPANDYRLTAKGIIEGPVQVAFAGSNAGVGAGSFCAFNTVLPNLWGAIGGSFGNVVSLQTLGTLGIGGATYAILKLFNINFISVALLPPFTTFVLAAVYEAVYFLFIVSVLLPIFTIFITITIAKEIAKVLGTEIDLSSLEKLI